MIRLDLAVVWRESILMGVHAFAFIVDYDSFLLMQYSVVVAFDG